MDKYKDEVLVKDLIARKVCPHSCAKTVFTDLSFSTVYFPTSQVQNNLVEENPDFPGRKDSFLVSTCKRVLFASTWHAGGAHCSLLVLG